MDVLQTDLAPNIFRYLAFCRLGVDFGSGIDEFNNIRTCPLRGRHVRNECENIAGLNSTEYSALEEDVVKKKAVTKTRHLP